MASSGASFFATYLRILSYMEVSKIRGPQYRPQNTMIPSHIIWTPPQKVPLILGSSIYEDILTHILHTGLQGRFSTR